jgi:hypothetical protein
MPKIEGVERNLAEGNGATETGEAGVFRCPETHFTTRTTPETGSEEHNGLYINQNGRRSRR